MSLYVVVRFELKAGEFDTLFPIIQEFFTQEVSKFPGFISARIHRNEEGTVLLNYATWESAEKFQRFMETARHSETSKRIQAFNPRTDRLFEVPL